MRGKKSGPTPKRRRPEFQPIRGALLYGTAATVRGSTMKDLAVVGYKDDVGRRAKQEEIDCPSCNEKATRKRNGDWQCTNPDCATRGVSLPGGELRALSHRKIDSRQREADTESP